MSPNGVVDDPIPSVWLYDCVKNRFHGCAGLSTQFRDGDVDAVIELAQYPRPAKLAQYPRPANHGVACVRSHEFVCMLARNHPCDIVASQSSDQGMYLGGRSPRGVFELARPGVVVTEGGDGDCDAVLELPQRVPSPPRSASGFSRSGPVIGGWMTPDSRPTSSGKASVRTALRQLNSAVSLEVSSLCGVNVLSACSVCVFRGLVTF